MSAARANKKNAVVVADQPAVLEDASYEPPAITSLGTLAELTMGATPGNNNDITFAGSGI